jgi:hypothetical protein
VKRGLWDLVFRYPLKFSVARGRNIISGGKLPILWEHIMNLPEQVLIRRRVQISDDGERMRLAIESLKQENSRLNELIVLLSERGIRTFPGNE